jgi:hypothetical protein
MLYYLTEFRVNDADLRRRQLVKPDQVGFAAPSPGQSVMGGPVPMDPWTPHAEPLGRAPPALLSQDLSGLRIGFISRTAAIKGSADVAGASSELVPQEGFEPPTPSLRMT